MRKPRKAKAMAADATPTPLGGARRVPVEFDDQGNVVEKAQPAAQPLGNAGKPGRRTSAKAATPPHQLNRSYVPGRTHVNPKTGTKHEDH